MGSRLGRALPKPLTELSDGRTIMRQQHDNIRAAFGTDARITAVVGYRAETIIEAFPNVNYVHNERYDETNTSKSLLRALGATGKSGVLWMNGDVVFDPMILGRAAAVVIGDRDDALHVRLDGPRTARVQAVCDHSGASTADAERTVDENDRAREAYVRNFYKCDARDLKLYHLMIDATALPHDIIADLIVTAAKARGLHTKSPVE
jgi:choline kinase